MVVLRDRTLMTHKTDIRDPQRQITCIRVQVSRKKRGSDGQNELAQNSGFRRIKRVSPLN